MLHPDPITSGVDGNVNVAMESGALFARKFDSEVRSMALDIVDSLSRLLPFFGPTGSCSHLLWLSPFLFCLHLLLPT